MRINPFRALRPTRELAAKVASVPYDVVNREEAVALAEGNPISFLHVCRPDIDLPADMDPHDDATYAKGFENLNRFQAEGTLARDTAPDLYIYRLVMDGKAQTGIVACVHIDDYEHDFIKKHEKTRRDKEDDRTRHVLEMNANAEPVFLTYKDEAEVARLMSEAAKGEALYDFAAVDGVRHTIWKAPDAAALVKAFGKVPHVYVADGHHRCASAWRAGKTLREQNPGHTGNEEYNWFLAVLFPASEVRIMAYNRVVQDLNGQTPAEVLEKLRGVGRVSATDKSTPPVPGSFCVYLDHEWHLVEIDEKSIDRSDPINSLDVALLESRILEPILGIGDIRTDKRIDFVGGIRGTVELQRRVNSGEMAIAFSMFPTTMEQLMAVADAGKIMPPKSTWFEPKLRSGLLVHTLD
ncbi:MAG: DUF1015 domain-containing protein [Phycisphaerales bacterium]|nr:DUF1015 domain-containing protein [Phycisphaerales bacterium]